MNICNTAKLSFEMIICVPTFLIALQKMHDKQKFNLPASHSPTNTHEKCEKSLILISMIFYFNFSFKNIFIFDIPIFNGATKILN